MRLLRRVLLARGGAEHAGLRHLDISRRTPAPETCWSSGRGDGMSTPNLEPPPDSAQPPGAPMPTVQVFAPFLPAHDGIGPDDRLIRASARRPSG